VYWCTGVPGGVYQVCMPGMLVCQVLVCHGMPGMPWYGHRIVPKRGLEALNI
jgi:hypothetical protein